jgi:hypothetical protein
VEELRLVLVMIRCVWKDHIWVNRIAFDDRKGQAATHMVCEEKVEERRGEESSVKNVLERSAGAAERGSTSTTHGAR